MGNFNIIEYIPVGRENAIKRSELRNLCGLSDREMRRAIENARKETPIINLSDGVGYYRPETREEITRYILQEKSRIKSINENIQAAIKTFNQIDGQLTL